MIAARQHQGFHGDACVAQSRREVLGLTPQINREELAALIGPRKIVVLGKA